MALARRCDELGYHRYWVAEHHASDTLASSSPEILVTRLAAETERIRVGSGGVMLSHYSPFKVAENFRLLEVLYPGRIDLGVGRAPGSDGLTAAALAYGNPLGIEYYPAKVKDLIAFVSGGIPITEAFHDLKATPKTATTPEVWMLGSSYDSAAYAARFGLPYSHAHFIAPQLATEALQQYRERFVPEHLTKAYASIGVFAIAVEDPSAPRCSGACAKSSASVETGANAVRHPPWKRQPNGPSLTRNSKPCGTVVRGRSSARRRR